MKKYIISMLIVLILLLCQGLMFISLEVSYKHEVSLKKTDYTVEGKSDFKSIKNREIEVIKEKKRNKIISFLLLIIFVGLFTFVVIEEIKMQIKNKK